MAATRFKHRYGLNRALTLSANMDTVKPQFSTNGKNIMEHKVETKRTPVPLTEDDRREIEAAMKRHGISTMGDFLRFAALYVARRGVV